MAKQMTAIRCGKEFRLAIAVQSKEGVAAQSANVLETLWATNGGWTRGRTIEDIAGSYGTIAKPKQGRIPMAFDPQVTATILPTRRSLPALLATLYGASVSRQVQGQIVETGDVDDELDNWILNGAIPKHNTDVNNKLYVDLTNPSGTTYKVEIYKDSGKLSLVASGQRDADGALSFTQENNSGLSGSVVVAWTDGESVVLEVKQLAYEHLANTFDKFLTIWWEDGKKTRRLVDCVITEMSFESIEKSSLRATVSIYGKELTDDLDPLLFTVPTQYDVYCHKRFGLTDMPGSQIVTESGDVDDELDNWIFAGVVMYQNTDSQRKLYADLTDAAGTRKVEVYKDSAKAAADKVAEGTKVSDGTLALVAVNDSGLSGSVDVTYSDGESVVLTVEDNVEMSVRSFMFSMTHEYEGFHGNSNYPLKHVKEAFLAVKGNLKSKYTDEMDDFFRRADQDPVDVKELEAKYSLGDEFFEVEFHAVDFEGEPPAFTDGKFDDFDSDFEALGESTDAGGVIEPLVMWLDLADMTP